MATPVVNLNGIFIRDTSVDLGTNLDTFHMMNMSKTPTPTDLGPIVPWIMTQTVQAPIYSIDAFRSSSIIPVDSPDGRYTYQMPATNDLPHFVRDIDPSNTRKGQGGVPFRICLNRRAYGLGAVITYDKFSGLEMFVDDVQDYGTGEFIYTVRIVNTGTDRYLDNNVLTPQYSVFRVGSGIGEYGENYDNMTNRVSYREFYNYTSNVEATFSYNCTTRAAMWMNKSNPGKGVPIKQLWKINDPDMSKDVSMLGLDNVLNKIGQVELLKKIQDGTIWFGFNTMVEMEGMQKIVTDIETYGMWGKGGQVRMNQDPAGRDTLRFPVGIWRQLDTAYKRSYSIGDYVPDILKNTIYNFFNGRVDFKGPDPQRKLIVQTGIGGMNQMMSAIQQMANNSGLVQNASEIGAISGKALSLDFGYAFQSYTIPFLANVKFELNPAFDNVQANIHENPMVNGFRLSSYCYIVYEVNEGVNDNIRVLQNTNYDNSLQYGYINGTFDYMGKNAKGVNSASKAPGYEVWMRQYLKNYWVVDPTRVLKVVPINPITRLPFGSFA